MAGVIIYGVWEQIGPAQPIRFARSRDLSLGAMYDIIKPDDPT